jgi:hypothetical protein
MICHEIRGATENEIFAYRSLESLETLCKLAMKSQLHIHFGEILYCINERQEELKMIIGKRIYSSLQESI